jgi:hypothetical protein
MAASLRQHPRKSERLSDDFASALFDVLTELTDGNVSIPAPG